MFKASDHLPLLPGAQETKASKQACQDSTPIFKAQFIDELGDILIFFWVMPCDCYDFCCESDGIECNHKSFSPTKWCFLQGLSGWLSERSSPMKLQPLWGWKLENWVQHDPRKMGLLTLFSPLFSRSFSKDRLVHDAFFGMLNDFDICWFCECSFQILVCQSFATWVSTMWNFTWRHSCFCSRWFGVIWDDFCVSTRFSK